MSTLSSAQMFERDRYLQVSNFLQPTLLHFFHRYVLMRAQNGQLPCSDKQVPGTPSMYADPLMETLMELALPQVEELTKLKLFPTYSYFRVYKKGDVLRPHIDRPSCEVSFTICLGFDVNNLDEVGYNWPIYIDTKKDFRHSEAEARRPAKVNDGVPVILNPGDCAIYRGCEARHWRDAFKGNYQAQAFIHYVERDGPYAKYKFDTRPMLGASADKIKDRGPYEFFPKK